MITLVTKTPDHIFDNIKPIKFNDVVEGKTFQFIADTKDLFNTSIHDEIVIDKANIDLVFESPAENFVTKKAQIFVMFNIPARTLVPTATRQTINYLMTIQDFRCRLQWKHIKLLS